jgi:hypothetical protein
LATIGYGYGSEWHLLQHLGRRRAAFTRQIQALTKCTGIEWVDHDEYVDPSGCLTVREPRGLEFLASADPIRQEWELLWPQSGAVHNWDAVGRTTAEAKSSWILVEAKAHLGELVSSCTATAATSRDRIQKVLNQTRTDLGATSNTDWTREHYQYCNRLALLHFLRVHSIDAHLIFVYFTGDRMDIGRAGRECPVSEGGWQETLETQDRYVGLPSSAPIRGSIHRLILPAYRANLAEQILSPQYRRSRNIQSLPAAPTPLATARSSELARAFDKAMMQIYLVAKNEVGYNATRFLQMLGDHGGVETARRLLPHMSDGFTHLWQRNRLDLTVESLILQPQWCDLFSDAERKIAHARLIDCGGQI